MIKDRYGLSITTNSENAAGIYLKAMDSDLAGNAFSEQWFQEASAMAPDFALAHIAHAENLLLLGKQEESDHFKNKALLQLKSLTERERNHIHIMILLMEGNHQRALQAIIQHVKNYPTDALLVSKAVGGFGLFAFSGEMDGNENRLQFMNSLASDYGEDWWFLSMHAFSHIELYQFEEANLKIEKSFMLYERNGHAAHSYAHLCYETGQIQECIDFSSKWLKDYEREAHLYGHIHWHWALSELAIGNFEKVQEIYQTHLRPQIAKGGALGLIADASALEWRSKLKGKELLDSDLKKELQLYAVENRNMNEILFGEAHLALLFTGEDWRDHREDLLSTIKNRNLTYPHPKYDMMVNLLEGINAFANKDYNAAANHLSLARPQLTRLGGSRAQRDIFEDTLLESYLKLNAATKATELINSRIHRK